MALRRHFFAGLGEIVPSRVPSRLFFAGLGQKKPRRSQAEPNALGAAAKENARENEAVARANWVAPTCRRERTAIVVNSSGAGEELKSLPPELMASSTAGRLVLAAWPVAASPCDTSHPSSLYKNPRANLPP